MPLSLPKGFLSFSQVSQYARCPSCYEARYVHGWRTPVSINLVLGHALHEAVKQVRTCHVLSHQSLPNPKDVASDAFDAELKSGIDKETGAEATIDLSSQFRSIGEAKDMAVQMAAFAAETLMPIDVELGLKAVEVRIWGLGQPYDTGEQQWQKTMRSTPIFPFPFLAYADAMYENALKDTKTAHRLLMPDYLTALQLTLYRLPWRRTGYTDFKAGVDQFAKRKGEELTPEKDYRAYWLDSDEERDQQAIDFVLQIAGDISKGIFPPRPSYMCLFDHGMPGLVRAER
jgi:hypothetical protein